MLNQQTNFFYYPTSIMLVDDNERYLHSLQLRLKQDAHYILHANPQHALAQIDEHRISAQVVEACLKTQVEDTSEDTYRLDLSALHHCIYQANRLQEVSVLVVDYAMPQMNGLQFCKQLRDSPVKKIMLTGMADADLAVAAFNDGLIDLFLMKDREDSFEQLDRAILKLQHEYWAERIQSLFSVLPTDSILNKADFRDLHGEICQCYQLVESYPLNASGDMLFLDQQAKPHWLGVYDAARLNTLLNIAEGNEAPNEILTMIRQRQVAPFFSSESDLQVPVDQWRPYLQPLRVWQCKQPLYYSHIYGEPLYDNQLNPIPACLDQ